MIRTIWNVLKIILSALVVVDYLFVVILEVDFPLWAHYIAVAFLVLSPFILMSEAFVELNKKG